MTAADAPLFRFEMWATARRNDPYYHTNWSGKQKITVLAANKQEAINRAADALGDLGRHWHWVFRTVSVTDHRIPEEVAQ